MTPKAMAVITSFLVVRFQFSDDTDGQKVRSDKVIWTLSTPLHPVKKYRVVVGATGRAPAMHGWIIFCRGKELSVAGELPLNVTNLRILPGMGKMELAAGSPEVGTRGKRYPHNNATLKRVA